MKTTAEKIAVMQAFLDGKQIETFSYKSSTEWTLFTGYDLLWNWIDTDYRVAITKPAINPNHVHPDYKWMATEKNGRTWLHKNKPECSLDGWSSADNIVNANVYASFKPGTCDWKDSLVNIREELQK